MKLLEEAVQLSARPLERLIGRLGTTPPDEYEIRTLGIDATYEVSVFAGGTMSSQHYVSFARGAKHGADDAVAAVADRYCGDWQFTARMLPPNSSISRAPNAD